VIGHDTGSPTSRSNASTAQQASQIGSRSSLTRCRHSNSC